ncbi:TetR/AcrR family transcriptional regulator [Roseibaca sp. Y0-43]|uniref:TetR/AcrR family transcriptional regulator n=1 Tax=Roseibaca sp. Y0-43 TaxID=2816854 RepID=UPI001D0C09A4|nr:TetR/AcrR family transcriptional regulator [Roseibaca sp. Y0-43]MCC1482279.1 TetR family transcriptional regulator [Roseibaca sp. Y0-43]
MTELTAKKPRIRRKGRNADQAKADLLASAKREFAEKGFALAGIEGIAEPTGLNKKMIYHYFGSKEDLYIAVLEDAYLGIRKMEEALPLEDLAPLDALRKLVEATWDYFVANPEFIALVNQENLLGAVYLDKSGIVKGRTSVLLKRVEAILRQGVAQGTIRPGIDALQLNNSIAALGFYYLNNRFTNSQIYNYDHMTDTALKTRRAFIVDFVLRAIMSKEEIARRE